MTTRLRVGQRVKVESRNGKQPYNATIVRIEGVMVMVKGEDGNTRLVPFRDVTPDG